MNLFSCLLIICGLLWMSPGYSAEQNTSLTHAQGESILKELRAIRILLEKQGVSEKKKRKPRALEYVDMSITGRPFLGNKDAPLLIVEFTDYQCPFCQRFHNETFPKLKKEYIDTGKLRFVSMDLPLGFHDNANDAANAAKCAADQQKFWQLRDLMIENYKNLSVSDVEAYARKLDMDMTRFNTCMQERPHQVSIDADLAVAKKAGITGTPTFLVTAYTGIDRIKGRKLVGAQPYKAFEGVMKTELYKQKAASAVVKSKPQPDN